MAPPKLRITGLRKTYGQVVALSGADLEMREGEFLTLLGPSGSGKTTMLMIIAGLVQPDSGEVWIDENLATYAPSHVRDIGMVFQNYALFPHLTVFENIAFPLRMRGIDGADIRREVTRVLELIQLPDVQNRLPRALSGGQQQRIALARCIVYKPSIILMDEPLGALDKKLRDQMKLEIKHLHQELGITVLYVTHDQEEAMVMSDRICLMNDAKIEQLGSPNDLYFRPRTMFAADFLGESNFLSATVEDISGDELLLRGGDGATIAVDNDKSQSIAKGDAVQIMVRPEMLRLMAPEDEAQNVLEGHLEEVILVGGVTKYYVRLKDDTAIVATGLTRGPVEGLEENAAIRLGWDKENAVVLPSEGA